MSETTFTIGRDFPMYRVDADNREGPEKVLQSIGFLPYTDKEVRSWAPVNVDSPAFA